MLELCKKSVGASLAVSLWVYILLKVWEPFGPFLFALWLLTVCMLWLNLYTWKCGYVIEQKSYKNLLYILIINLISGYLLWWLISWCNDTVVLESALTKVNSREISWPFFIKSIFCGIIMFLAVDLYKKWTNLWIIFWIPLFIFCGFQHCIANVITMWVAHAYDNSLWIAVIWNLIGSLFIRYLWKDFKKK